MLITPNTQLLQTPFENEAELENVVSQNAEYIFGPGSLYLPKRLIRTLDDHGTIPDGFVVDVPNRQWFVVEVELARHSVWGHIAPQVAKQIIAAQKPITRQLLTELVISLVRDDEEMMEKFTDENISTLDVRGVLAEIFNTPPIIGMPIDSISQDLRAWAETLKVDVKLWTIRKYVDFSDSSNIVYEIPEEYRPDVDTREEADSPSRRVTQYDVTIDHLLMVGLLEEGQECFMSYKPRNGERKEYTATIHDGSLRVLDKTFGSPSYAALYGIQDAGSKRRTVNGWTSWKNANGRTLAELRDEYLNSIDSEETEQSHSGGTVNRAPDA